jgi:hypothetical protein
MRLFEKLNDDNFYIYAAKNYINPTCIDIKEFDKDLQIFAYINKLFSRFEKTNRLSERLLLNHIIILYNVFNAEACTRMLFYKTQEKFYPQIKTILLFLGKISDSPNKIYLNHKPEVDYSVIELDLNLAQKLKEL